MCSFPVFLVSTNALGVAPSARGIPHGNQFVACAGVVAFVFVAHLTNAAATWIMEFMSVCVQHIFHTGRAAGGWSLGGYDCIAIVCGAVGAYPTKSIGVGVAFHRERYGVPIAGANHIALHICTENFHIGVAQSAESGFCGMTVGVACANGDNRILRHDLTQKGVGG